MSEQKVHYEIEVEHPISGKWQVLAQADTLQDAEEEMADCKQFDLTRRNPSFSRFRIVKVTKTREVLWATN